MTRVLIVDDHPMMRDGLTAVLSNQQDIVVVGVAATGRAAIEEVARLRPDVVLMDLQMPEMDGVAAIAAIHSSHPTVHVLVLTTYDTDSDIAAAIEAGAAGYLLKDADRDELCAAIRSVARGESALSPSVAAKVVARMRGDAGFGLSTRELEVLTAVARGHNNKQVARALFISEATVKTHLVHIFAKLNVEDRTAAATTALANGIIRLDSAP